MKKEDFFPVAKAYIILVLFVLSNILLSACGEGKEGNMASSRFGVDGYVYVPQSFAPGDSMEARVGVESYARWHDLKYRNGFLYYSFGGDAGRIAVDGESGQALSGAEIVADLGSMGRVLVAYTVDEEGNLYLLATNILSYTATQEDLEKQRRKASLIKLTPDGKTAYKITLSEMTIFSESGTLALDGGNRLYLLATDGIYLFDEEGNVAGRIETKGFLSDSIRSQTLMSGEGGKVYYCTEDYSNVTGSKRNLYEVQEERLALREEASDLRGNLWESPYGILLEYDGSISQYQQESHAFQEVMRLEDSNLYAVLSEFVQISGERFLTCCVDQITDDYEWYVLTRTPVEEVPDRETLVVATCQKSSELTNAAARFNRKNGSYRVVVEAFTGDGWQERMDARIVSAHPPDLLDMARLDGSLDVRKYAEGQVLEDLTPYLEASSLLDPEMIWEGIIDSYTIGGRLVCIPTKFYIRALVVRSGLLGTGKGWTLEEMREELGKYPQLMPVQLAPKVGGVFDAMLTYLCAEGLLERYVDLEKRECHFTDEEFWDFMEWLADYSRGKELVRSEWIPQIQSESLISALTEIRDAWDLVYCCRGSDGTAAGVSIKGFPEADGEPVYYGIAQDSLGILSSSKNKEGAWAFLEYYLTRGYDMGYSIPCRKDVLMEYLKEEMTPEYYLDSEGKPAVDSEGNPWKKVKNSVLVNGESIDYDVLPQEAANQFLDILAHTRFLLRSHEEENILAIIDEEMPYYLNGQKLLEEVADVIQKRASLVLGEGLSVGRTP